jgi:hypothetical protein
MGAGKSGMREIARFTSLRRGKRILSIRYVDGSGTIFEKAGDKWFKKVGGKYLPCHAPQVE